MEPRTLVTVPRDSLPSRVYGALRLHRADPFTPDKSEKKRPFFRVKAMSDYSRLATWFEAASLISDSRTQFK